MRRPMIVGYARTSTIEQLAGLAGQERDLKGAGAERVFAEQTSATGKRPKLDEALRFVRDGDVLMATKPDRLARSVRDLLAIVDDLAQRKVGLVILSMGGQQVDTRSPTGKLMITMLGAVAEFERSLMLERQREGIAKAASEGKYKGRAPTARRQSSDVIRLAKDGVTRQAIADQLGLGIASVYRILAEARSATHPG